MFNKSSQHITIYKPNQRHELGFFRTWIVMAHNIVEAKELIWQLFKRDFLASYKKSFIGVSWLFISPLVGIISWVFLQKTGMLQPGDVGIPYPAYVLIGTSMWGLFMGFFNAAKETLSAGKALVMQVNYPHEALLFMQTAQHLANFLITFGITIVVLLLFGVLPSWKIVLFPLVIVPLFFLAAAIGLVVSMIAVVSIDFDKIVNVCLGLMMWITPIIYSDKVDNQFVQTLIAWNPLTYLVCSAISWRLFYVSEDKIIERMI
jgi:lipopolysaccharide transport system permease protein